MVRSLFIASLFLIGCASASPVASKGPQAQSQVFQTNTGTLKRVGPYALLRLGDIDRDSVMALIQGIQEAERQSLPILLEVNSGGGSTGAGFLLAKVIENSEVKVRCLVDGVAASMALEILWSCDERVATPRSIFMFHQPKTGMDPDKRYTPDELKNEFEELSVFWRTLCLDAAYYTKLPFQACVEHTSGGKELYFDAQQALKYGLVSEIVSPVRPLKP